MKTDHRLVLIEKLTALAQSGLAYSEGVYDRDRYEQLRALTQELHAALGSPLPTVEAGSPAVASAVPASSSNAGAEQFARWYPDEEGYRTPKVDVRAVVFRQDQVLLVHEKSDNRWSVPGGWADVGESPCENVIKEVWEESGYRARVVRLLALLDRANHGHGHFPWYTYKAFYLCEVEGTATSGTMETHGAGFFSMDELPELSTGRVTEAQLRRFREMVQSGQESAWID